MKKIILCGFIVVVLMLAACQAPGAASSTDIVSGNDTAAESPTQELSAEETIRRFFECFNNRDAEGINALMETGLRMTLTEEESAVLKLISCTELQTDGEASVVEAVFDVKLDDRICLHLKRANIHGGLSWIRQRRCLAYCQLWRVGIWIFRV